MGLCHLPCLLTTYIRINIWVCACIHICRYVYIISIYVCVCIYACVYIYFFTGLKHGILQSSDAKWGDGAYSSPFFSLNWSNKVEGLEFLIKQLVKGRCLHQINQHYSTDQGFENRQKMTSKLNSFTDLCLQRLIFPERPNGVIVNPMWGK